MDIRNIKEQAPEVQNGAYLEKMFDLQKDLMEGYIRIEGLPRYPVNIHSKKSQVVLKDMASRVTEELAEGYESTDLACCMMNKVGWNLNKLSQKEYKMLLNHLQNSNEEQADATAFYLELLIYAGVTPEDLRGWALTQIDDSWDYDNPNTCPLLELLMIIGVSLLNSFDEFMLEEAQDINENNLYDLLNIDILGAEEYVKVQDYTPGFTRMSSLLHHREMNYLWQIQYHLGVGRNYLKNKPWKQSGELSDESRYFQDLYIGFAKLLGYHVCMGITPEPLYKLFFKKNRVNVFRQNSNY